MAVICNLDPSFPGDASDDSYMSAEDEPAEGPRFEKPLLDAAASTGSEVMLKCTITGSPTPTGTVVYWYRYWSFPMPVVLTFCQ